MSGYTVVWHGGSWRDELRPVGMPHPVRRMTDPVNARVRRALDDEWRTPRRIADQALCGATTAQRCLHDLVTQGEAEAEKVTVSGRGYQVRYRRRR